MSKAKESSVSFVLSDPIYRADIKLFVGNKDFYVEEVNRMHKATVNIDGDVSGMFEIIRKKEESYYLVWIEKWRRGNISDRGVLAHELLHTSFGVLRDCGLRSSSSAEEAYTYYFEHLFMQAQKSLKKYYGW